MKTASATSAPVECLPQPNPGRGGGRAELWLRRAMDRVRHPAVAEAACVALALPPSRMLAWHVFFRRGSFPDVEPRPADARALAVERTA